MYILDIKWGHHHNQPSGHDSVNTYMNIKIKFENPKKQILKPKPVAFSVTPPDRLCHYIKCQI